MNGSGTETLVFDVYGTLVDPISVTGALQERYGSGVGAAVARDWRARQLEYSFRLTVMGQYLDFRQLTRHALIDTLTAHALTANEDAVDGLAGLYDELEPFPDTEPGLRALRDAGHRLKVFTNGTVAMVERCLAVGGLSDFFDDVISADEVGAFKPAPAVYFHAAERTSLPVGRLRLVSANPFDIIGANAAGMRTAWVQRSTVTFDSIGRGPDVTVPRLDLLPAALSAGE
jgi:2-haloacid dehalogenase